MNESEQLAGGSTLKGEGNFEELIRRKQLRQARVVALGVGITFLASLVLFLLFPEINPWAVFWMNEEGGLPGASLVELEDLEADIVEGTQLLAREGYPPPDIQFVDLEGRKGLLSAFKGTRVLINLWGSWCPPCREEMPMFAKVYKEEGGGELFEIIAIADSRSPEEEVRRMKESIGMEFIVTIDKDDDVFRRYRVRAVPTSVVISNEGLVERVIIGAMTEEEFKRYVLPRGQGLKR